MLTNFWSTIHTSFRRMTGSRPEVHVDDSINHLPPELILMIADNLSGFTEINSLMRTNRRHLQLLMPIILDRAIISPPSHISSENRTILHRAATHTTGKLLPALLQRPQVDMILNVADSYGATPLHSATFWVLQGAVRMLLNKGANMNATMDDAIGDGWTPLHLAVFWGNDTLIATLLAAGAGTEARTYAGSETPLFLAALRQDNEIMRLLVRHGANTLACRKDGSNIQEYVNKCKDKWVLAILPTLVFERLLSIESMCRCVRCATLFRQFDGTFRSKLKYPKGCTGWVQGAYITH